MFADGLLAPFDYCRVRDRQEVRGTNCSIAAFLFCLQQRFVSTSPVRQQTVFPRPYLRRQS
jgi:hypothetical protein